MPIPPIGFDFYTRVLDDLRRSRQEPSPRPMRPLPPITVTAPAPEGFDFYTRALADLRRSAQENDPRRIRQLPPATVTARMPEPDPMDAPLRAMLNLGAPVIQSTFDATAGLARGATRLSRLAGLPGDLPESIGQRATLASQRVGNVIEERAAPRNAADVAARIVGSAALPVAGAIVSPALGLGVTGAMSAGNPEQSGTRMLADATGNETLRRMAGNAGIRAASDVAFDRIVDAALPLAVGSLRKAKGAGQAAQGGTPTSYETLLRDQAIGTQGLRDVDPATGTTKRGDGPLVTKTTLALDPSGEGAIAEAQRRLIESGQRVSTVSDAAVFEQATGVDVDALIRSGRVRLTTPELAAVGKFVREAKDRADELTRAYNAEVDEVKRQAIGEELDQVFAALVQATGRFEKAKSEQGRGLRILSRFAAQRGDPEWALATVRRLTKNDQVAPEVEDAVKRVYVEHPVPPEPTPEQIQMAKEYRRNRSVIEMAARQQQNPLTATDAQTKAARSRREAQAAIRDAEAQAQTPITATPEQQALANQRREAQGTIRAAERQATDPLTPRPRQPEAPDDPRRAFEDTEGVTASNMAAAREVTGEEARRKALDLLGLGSRPATPEEVAERSKEILEAAQRRGGLQRLTPDELNRLRELQESVGNPIEDMAGWLAQMERDLAKAADVQATGGPVGRQLGPNPREFNLLTAAKEGDPRRFMDIPGMTRGVDRDLAAARRMQTEGPRQPQQGPAEPDLVTRAENAMEGALERERTSGVMNEDFRAAAEYVDAFNKALDQRAAALARTLQDAQKESWLDAAMSFRRTGMLLWPVTHGINVISGITNTAERVITHPLAAAIDRVVATAKGRPRAITAGREYWQARVSGAKEGLRKAIDPEVFLRGIDPDDPFEALARQRTNYVNSFNLNPREGEAAWRKVARPTAKVMQAVSDVVFGTMNIPDQTLFRSAFKAGLAERAVLRAQRQGLKPGTETYTATVADLMTPDGASPEDVILATDEAMNEVFKSRTAIGEAIGRAHVDNNKLTRFVSKALAPFGKTPGNLFNTTVDLLPGAGELRQRAAWTTERERLIKQMNLPRTPEEAALEPAMAKDDRAMTLYLEEERRKIRRLVRQGTGASLLAAGALTAIARRAANPYLEGEGNSETQQKRQLRDAPPGGVSVGGNWWSTTPFGPQGIMFNIGAAIAEQILEDTRTANRQKLTVGTNAAKLAAEAGRSPAEQQAAADSAAATIRPPNPLLSGTLAVGRSLGTQVSELPMLSGIFDLAGGLASGGAKTFGTWAGRQAASFIPFSSGVAGVARAMDPVRDRTVQSFGDAIKERVPGLRETLPPKLGVFGEVRPNPGALRTAFDPFRTRPDQAVGDPVIGALLANRATPTAPGWKRADGVTYEQYVAERRIEGPLEKDVLAALFQLPASDWAKRTAPMLWNNSAVQDLAAQGRTGEAIEKALSVFRNNLTRQQRRARVDSLRTAP